MPADKSVVELSAARERRVVWAEIAILLAAAGAVSATLFLHFLRPHGDFYEFRESGAALLAGELPATTKRGPVYSLAVALLGRGVGLFAVRAAPADQLGAAMLNAGLVPAIVLLSYCVTRGWSRAAAAWAGLAVLALPHLWLAGAHVLVEPLLAALLLLAVLAVQRGSGWAYVFAAIAAVTRYDLAGLLVGVALADWLRGARPGRVVLRTALAAAPLAAWLGLTVWTWQTHARDHYIEQMSEHAARGALRFDPLWAVRSVLNAAGAGARPGLPIWMTDVRPALHVAAPFVGGTLVLAGAAVFLRRRDAAMAAAVTATLAFVAVHALFPFRLERFGFPPAPLMVAIAAAGAAWLVAWARRGGTLVRGALIALGLLLFTAMLTWEFEALRATWVGLDGGARVRCIAVLLAVLGVASCAAARGLFPGASSPDRAAQRAVLALAAIACGMFAAAGLALANGRDAHALLGKRRSESPLVDAAAWVCAKLPDDARVLSGVGGLLALHCRGGTERFPGFEQIAAEDWDSIVRECAERRIGYVLWYEGFLEEQGEYYIAKWRLERYARLDEEASAGLEVVQRFAGDPAVVIYRLGQAPEPPATHPSGASSSGGEPTNTAPGGGGSRIPSPPRKSP